MYGHTCVLGRSTFTFLVSSVLRNSMTPGLVISTVAGLNEPSDMLIRILTHITQTTEQSGTNNEVYDSGVHDDYSVAARSFES